MVNFRSSRFPAVALVAGALAVAAPHGATQDRTDQGDPSRAKKSVYGKLERVDPSLNGVIMRSDEGKRLAWQFDKRVIVEMEKFKPGDPMIVIYRQISKNEKRVTAIAFPGSASTPTYVNLTGSRAVLRSAPMVGGVCGNKDAEPVQEYVMPIGGRAEAPEACWCCTTTDENCIPANKTGTGQALLAACFE